MDRPKVFQQGTLTVVLGPTGLRLYAGATELPDVESVAFATGVGDLVPLAVLKFLRSPDPEVDRRLEEQERAAKSVRWPGLTVHR